MPEDFFSDIWRYLTGAPLRSLIIVVVGVAVVVISRWVLTRVMRRLATAPLPVVDDVGKVVLRDAVTEESRARRVNTLHQLFASTIGAVVAVVVAIMVLGEFGVDVRPLILSAGVVGVAIAFGTQSLVTDVVTGLFMLIENQYNVGDRVELGGPGTLAIGTIEEVGLRVTSVRDDDGRLWYVRNGQILRVANESQGWSLAVVDLSLAPETDLTKVRDDVETWVRDALADPALAGVARPGREPTVSVLDISASAAVLEVQARAEPGQKQRLASVLRRRLYAELARAGIKLA